MSWFDGLFTDLARQRKLREFQDKQERLDFHNEMVARDRSRYINPFTGKPHSTNMPWSK